MYTSYSSRRQAQRSPAGLAMVLAIGLLVILAFGVCFAILFGPSARRAAAPPSPRQLQGVTALVAASASVKPSSIRS